MFTRFFCAHASSTHAPPTVHRNVSYAPPAGCTTCPSCTCLDVYAPSSAIAAPFVLFVHGGVWVSGSRDEVSEVCHAVIERSNGTVGCATADYRYSQDLGGNCSRGPPTCAEIKTCSCARHG